MFLTPYPKLQTQTQLKAKSKKTRASQSIRTQLGCRLRHLVASPQNFFWCHPPSACPLTPNRYTPLMEETNLWPDPPEMNNSSPTTSASSTLSSDASEEPSSPGSINRPAHDYSFRREWIRRRLESLASVFGIDVLTYAILSNHIHVILRNRPMSWPLGPTKKLH